MAPASPRGSARYRLNGKRGKNDAPDAAAICEAVKLPNMRFVQIKTEAGLARLSVHRMRHGFVERSAGSINCLRGPPREFGIVLPQKAAMVRR